MQYRGITLNAKHVPFRFVFCSECCGFITEFSSSYTSFALNLKLYLQSLIVLNNKHLLGTFKTHFYLILRFIGKFFG